MRATVHNQLLRAVSELEDLNQVNERLVPGLAKALGASFVFAYRGLADEQGIRAYLPPTTPDLIADYFAEYAGECPLRKVKDRVKGSVVPTTALYGHGRLIKTRVYNELWRPWGFDHHVALRFDDPGGGPEVASLGLMINRDHRRGEYTQQELRFLRGLTPSIAGAFRRAAHIEVLRERVEALEHLLDPADSAPVRLVLDADGHLLHAEGGPEAERVINLLRTPHHPVRRAARQLLRPTADEPLSLEHRVVVDEREQWRATLQLSERRAARPAVIIGLSPADGKPRWKAQGLSRAEGAVLDELVAGRSNREIGRRLFISPETVRTHLTRIYKKLGVRSRLEAVLKARLRGSA